MILNIFTLVVMVFLAVAIGVLIAWLGVLPGRIARKRGHPQADAINVASWVGIITMGLAWPLALIWAYTRPAGHGSGTPDELEQLGARLDAVEQQLAQLHGEKEAGR